MGIIARWEAADAGNTDDQDAAVVAVDDWRSAEGFGLLQSTALDRPVRAVDERGQPYLQFEDGQSLSMVLPQVIREAAAAQLTVVMVTAFDLPATPRTVLTLDNDADADPFFLMSTLAANQGRLETQDVGAANGDALVALADPGFVGRTWSASIDNTAPEINVGFDAAEDVAVATALFGPDDLNRLTIGADGAFKLYALWFFDSALTPELNQLLAHTRVGFGFSTLDPRTLPGIGPEIGGQTVRYDASVGVSENVERWQQHAAGISVVQATPADRPSVDVWASKAGEQALLFDGVSDHMTADPDGIQQEGFSGFPAVMTFALVFRVTGSGDRVLFDSPASGGTGFSARVTAAGVFEFTATGDAGTLTLSTPVPNDTDLFITGRVGLTTSRLLINGIEADTATTPAMGDFGEFTPGDAAVGAAVGGSDHWAGQIADVSISNGFAANDAQLPLLDLFIGLLYGVPIGPVAALRLQGNAGVTGDPVDAWASQGTVPGSVTAAGADRPTLTTLGALQALDFSGAQHLADAAALDAIVDGADGVSVVMVVDLDSPSNGETLLHLDDGSNEVELFLRTGSALLRAVVDPGSGVTTTLDGPTPPSVPSIIDFRVGPGGAELRVDEVSADTDTGSAIILGPHTTLAIMSDSAGASETAGVCAEVLVFDREISNTYRDACIAFLQLKWGI